MFGLLLLPVAAIIAVLVLVTSGRPILYRGERVGRHGRFFAMLKFRTLKRDAELRLGPYLGEELVRLTEAEYTRVGRWLKASQLDEIPQLWDVLRGDMSFVGPRPIRARFFAELATDLPAYWQRLVVRPGLTGLAQVRRGYETSMAEKLAHDLEWVADRSVRALPADAVPDRRAGRAAGVRAAVAARASGRGAISAGPPVEARSSGCHSSIRLPSGSVTQPNRPTPSMSCVSSATSAPLARSCGEHRIQVADTEVEHRLLGAGPEVVGLGLERRERPSARVPDATRRSRRRRGPGNRGTTHPGPPGRRPE